MHQPPSPAPSGGEAGSSSHAQTYESPRNNATATDEASSDSTSTYATSDSEDAETKLVHNAVGTVFSQKRIRAAGPVEALGPDVANGSYDKLKWAVTKKKATYVLHHLQSKSKWEVPHSRVNKAILKLDPVNILRVIGNYDVLNCACKRGCPDKFSAKVIQCLRMSILRLEDEGRVAVYLAERLSNSRDKIGKSSQASLAIVLDVRNASSACS